MLFHHLNSRYTSIDEYIHDTEMDRNFTWGTDVEMLTMAHLLNTCKTIDHEVTLYMFLLNAVFIDSPQCLCVDGALHVPEHSRP